MMERTINRNEKEFKNFEIVAKMLEMLSPNGATYTIKETYLDFGQYWKWTTIIRNGEVQVLSPREWEAIYFADNPKELAEITEEIRNDRFFGDK